MKSPHLRLLNQLFALFFLLVLASCGGSTGGTSSSAKTGAIAVNLTSAEAAKLSATKSSLQPGTVTIRFSVSGPGMTTMNMDFPVAAGKGVINGVPIGTGRILTIQGLDVNGLVISSAEVPNISVLPGQTSDLGTVVMQAVGPITKETLVGNWYVTEKVKTTWHMTCSFAADGTGNCTEYDSSSSYQSSFAAVWTYDQTSKSFSMKLANSNGGAMGGTISGGVDNFYVDGHWSSGNSGYFHWVRQAVSGYNISGKVLVNGTGLVGATVSAGTQSAITLADGSYTIANVPNGSYSLTASKGGYSFTPSSISATVNNANLTGQDFTGTAVTTGYSISGIVTNNGSGLPGVLITAGAYSAITGADGTYTITGMANGNYTLIASKTGVSFWPSEVSVTVNNSNVAGINFNTATGYSISGKVTHSGLGLQGVTVNLAIGSTIITASATTGTDGSFTINGVPNGNYSLTASKIGYSFYPSVLSVNVNGANLSQQNFSTAPDTYSISGTITHAGLPQAGVMVSIGSTYVVTDSNGMYTINGLANGTYTLIPSKTGYTFSPTSSSVTISGANSTGRNFSSTSSSTYSISGTITHSGVPQTGVTVSTGSSSTVTDSNGMYTLSGLANGNYTVTPSKSGYTFSPVSSSVTVNGANVTGQNFTSTSSSTYTISGVITDSGGYGLSGVIVTSGGYSAVTDNNGMYTISGVPNGSYTLIPSKSGFSFSPASRSATVSGSNLSGHNFTAYIM